MTSYGSASTNPFLPSALVIFMSIVTVQLVQLRCLPPGLSLQQLLASHVYQVRSLVVRAGSFP